MEICVFGETIEADQESYEKLLNRIFVEVFHTDSPVFRRLDNLIIRGKGDLVTQLPINLRSITRKFSNISCAFVFLDADGEYPSKTNSERKRVRDKVSNFKETFAGEIIIGVPTRNIEAWLLSDSNNLIFNTKLSNLPSYTKVEEIEKPLLRRNSFRIAASNDAAVVISGNKFTSRRAISKICNNWFCCWFIGFHFRFDPTLQTPLGCTTPSAFTKAEGIV